jgi:hypothetical protein
MEKTHLDRTKIQFKIEKVASFQVATLSVY